MLLKRINGLLGIIIDFVMLFSILISLGLDPILSISRITPAL